MALFLSMFLGIGCCEFSPMMVGQDPTQLRSQDGSAELDQVFYGSTQSHITCDSDSYKKKGSFEYAL